MEKAGIPFFKKADLDASIGVFFDGFSKVIVAIAILAGTFGLDGGTIFGTMMGGPGPDGHTGRTSGRPYVYLALQYHAARVPQYRQCGSGI